jgi:elongation factor P--beta-lysine ligase
MNKKHLSHPTSTNLPAALQFFKQRQAVIRGIRSFFEEQGFDEVIVPVMNTGLPIEPTLYSFKTVWQTTHGEQELYLSVSPEAGIKKMIATGLKNVFAVGKCFRNLESAGTRHNPEFLMLEWYRQDAHYTKIMEDIQKLLLYLKRQADQAQGRPFSPTFGYQGVHLELPKKWPVVSLEKLLAEYAGVELSSVLELSALQKVANAKGYNVTGASWEQLFNQIVLNEVEPHFPVQPFFLIDFPAQLSPLCKTQQHKPYLAERFEFFINQMEIGNGNNEQTNEQFVRQHFETELEIRKKLGLSTHPIDESFLLALKKMRDHHYAGVGVGVDRVVMLFSGAQNIRDVDPFTL